MCSRAPAGVFTNFTAPRNASRSDPAQRCPLKHGRSALNPRLPNDKHPRNSDPAQHCIENDKPTTPNTTAQRCVHTCQMISIPAQTQPLRTVSTPAKLKAHPLRWIAYTRAWQLRHAQTDRNLFQNSACRPELYDGLICKSGAKTHSFLLLPL